MKPWAVGLIFSRTSDCSRLRFPFPAYAVCSPPSFPLTFFLPPLILSRITRRYPYSFQITNTASTTSTSTIAPVQYGWAEAIHDRNTAVPSSKKLSVQLLIGSGLVLAAARVVALAPCEVSATPPARSAAPSLHSSGTWPKAL